MTNGNPPDLSYAEPDLRNVQPDRYDVTDPRPLRREPSFARWLLVMGVLLLIGGAEAVGRGLALHRAHGLHCLELLEVAWLHWHRRRILTRRR